jgi:AcrR family transcriptional regulator
LADAAADAVVTADADATLDAGTTAESGATTDADARATADADARATADADARATADADARATADADATAGARATANGGLRSDMDGAAPTREALVRAGIRIFAEHGFAGASIRAITADAGANLGSITYHFGTKEAFYDVVIERTIAPFTKRVIDAARTDGAPLERLEQVVRAYFGHLAEHPEIPRLLLQGVVASGLPPAASMVWLKGLLGMLASIVEAGQAEGSIRGGDPRLLGLGVLSQSLHLAVMRRTLREVTGMDLTDADTRDLLVEHLVRFVRGGLAASSGESGG